MARTIDQMIIDHAGCLHVRIADRGPEKGEAPALHLLTDPVGQRGRGGHLAELAVVVDQGPPVDKIPHEAAEASFLLHHLKKAAGIMDRAFHFQAVADDTGVSQKARRFTLAKPGHLLRVKSGKGPAVTLAAPKDGQPGKPGLRPLKDNKFKKAGVLKAGDTPFRIMVLFVDRISKAPWTALFPISHTPKEKKRGPDGKTCLPFASDKAAFLAKCDPRMDKLQEIMAHKRKELTARTRPVRDSELARFCPGPHPHRFEDALRKSPGLAIISEIKRRSPSAGAIAEDRDAVEQARLYYNAGTNAISVLTDETYFGGSIRDLWAVNDLLGQRSDAPPTLRKDFFVDRLQVLEAAEAGAACILIIVRALSDEEMKMLFEAANRAGLDSIFEVHEAPEVDRALNCGARMIGVNNRDLTRFVTDLAVSEAIIPGLPDETLSISESGIFSLADAERAWNAGADAVLVGEALMKMEDPEPFIRSLHNL